MGSLGGAHQAGGPALPPQPPPAPPACPPACLALGSSIRPPPPRGPEPLLAPGRPECPPLRPGRCSRAPSRMPHPHPLAFSPSLPSPAGPVAVPAASLGMAPLQGRGGSAKRGRVSRDAASCLRPPRNDPRPSQTRVPLQPGPHRRGLSGGSCPAAKEGRTPQNLHHCSPRGRGRVGGREGAARRQRLWPRRGRQRRARAPRPGAQSMQVQDAGCRFWTRGSGGRESRCPTSPASVAAARHEHGHGRGSPSAELLPLPGCSRRSDGGTA